MSFWARCTPAHSTITVLLERETRSCSSRRNLDKGNRFELHSKWGLKQHATFASNVKKCGQRCVRPVESSSFSHATVLKGLSTWNLEPSWNHLGTILAPSWNHIGTPKESQVLPNLLITRGRSASHPTLGRLSTQRF